MWCRHWRWIRASGRISCAQVPGFGGSCLPKDAQALLHQAHQYGRTAYAIEAAIISNNRRVYSLADRIRTACVGDVRGQEMAIFGLSFKAGTDDIRESPALTVIPALLAAGARLSVYDPQIGKPGLHATRKLAWQDDVRWGVDAYDAATGCDGVVILTEWAVFAAN